LIHIAHFSWETYLSTLKFYYGNYPRILLLIVAILSVLRSCKKHSFVSKEDRLWSYIQPLIPQVNLICLINYCTKELRNIKLVIINSVIRIVYCISSTENGIFRCAHNFYDLGGAEHRNIEFHVNMNKFVSSARRSRVRE
jgi:hypothetical protein